MPLVAPASIESERLSIRLVAEADLSSLFAVNSDDEVTALLPYPTWTSRDDADAWYLRMADLQSTGTALQFVIVGKEVAAAIGTCLLFRFDEGSARVELSYVLGRAYWGRGLMHEALKALLDCAFATMQVRRIEAEVDTRNVRSAGLLRRLGFSKEGVLRERWVAKGETRDVAMHALLRGEWPSLRSGSGPTNDAVGFVVLYRWRVRAGMEQSFVSAWSRVTQDLRRKGSLGSRLHRGDDGIWYGYAQWPTDEARRGAFASPSGASDAVRAMNEAIAERLPEIRLDPLADHLVLK